jgi:hypothetical protein
VEVVAAIKVVAAVAATAMQRHRVIKSGNNGNIGATPVAAIYSMIAKTARILASVRKDTRMKLLEQTP